VQWLQFVNILVSIQTHTQTQTQTDNFWSAYMLKIMIVALNK